MFFDTIRKRNKFLAGLALISCIVFTVGVFFYRDDYVIDPRKWVGMSSSIFKSRYQKVLLPAGFKFSKESLEEHLKSTSGKDWETIQLEDWEVKKNPPLEPGVFKTTESNLYAYSKGKQCNMKENMKIGTDQSEQLSLNLKKVFEIFNEEADTYSDTYNQHVRPIFEKYMKDEKLDLHWFRFSGSSVWLKDYNIHFVVSRLSFSETPGQNDPKISLLLAQIFDEKWKEIEDVRLVFPTNKLKESQSFKIDDQEFMLDRFPRILPAPIYFEKEDLFWGAEDPRMTLVRNKNGHEEPIVVFNSAHGKEVTEEEDGDIMVELVRSMFMSLPFQRQKGKRILHMGDEYTCDNLFMRTNHVRSDDGIETAIEKNWTPFVSSAGEYDEHVYFTTLLKPLRVLKCKLWEDNKECSVEKEGGAGVGRLRGGTPLFSLKRIDDEDKEYFFGIARAHLRNCGCGKDFYRPNIVVVARKGDKWSLSHVSSSIDLGMDILPWRNETKLCIGVNAMIPNGIEYFDQERDLLSVYVSVSDITVERVTVHGVLQALENAKYWEGERPDYKKTPIKCALAESAEFCKAYGARYKTKRWYSPVFDTFSLI